MQLVRLFHQAHPDSPSSKYVASYHMTGFDELWVSLVSHVKTKQQYLGGDTSPDVWKKKKRTPCVKTCHPKLKQNDLVLLFSAMEHCNCFLSQAFLEMHGLLEACLPFLPKAEDDHDDEPTEQQSQSLWVEEAEETMEQTNVEDQRDDFMITLTGDCSVDIPL